MENFSRWCATQDFDPLEYNPLRVANFLAHIHTNSKTSFNALRVYVNAIQFFWKQHHPSMPSLVTHAHIKTLIKGSKIHSIPYQPVHWDVQPVLQKISELVDAPLQAQLPRTVMLLALCTSWRPRSDLGRIFLEDMSLTLKDGTLLPVSVVELPPITQLQHITILAHFPKEGSSKSTRLVPWSNQNICPVQAIYYILEKTLPRTDMKNARLLCIPRPPYSNASEDTLARWIKQFLQKCGIFARPHSTRAMASSIAHAREVPIDSILRAANWTSARTFFRHYRLGSSAQHRDPSPDPSLVASAVLQSLHSPSSQGDKGPSN